jgi:hypothetical protein
MRHAVEPERDPLPQIQPGSMTEAADPEKQFPPKFEVQLRQDWLLLGRSLGEVSTSYAREQLAIYKRQVREGTYEKRVPRPTEPERTVADMWTLYLELQTRRQESPLPSIGSMEAPETDV